MFLESESTPGLSFLVLPVTLIEPQYRLAMSREDRETIAASENSPLLCLAVITAVENSAPSANLLAPVVINLQNGRAVQAVRSDSVYSHKKVLCS
jgi:flagellar assembly factor FliW